MKLNEKALGLSGGILWAAALTLATLFSLINGYGSSFVEAIQPLYIGYGPSFLGIIIGAIWGFLDGFIGCYAIAWLYNKLNK